MSNRLLLLFSMLGLACAGCGSSTITVVPATDGMAPTIKAGDRVALDPHAYNTSTPSRWDIVAIDSQLLRELGIHNLEGPQIKRVVGLPNESISITSEGIFVDGRVLAIPHALSNLVYTTSEAPAIEQSKSFVSFPYSIPPNHYFVLGDNWTNSLDSRYYGAAPLKHVIGKVRSDALRDETGL
jgi:signal peptidase I